MSNTQNFLVSWEINVDAETPLEAAQEAHRLMKKARSTANVFDVIDENADTTRIDLQEEIEAGNIAAPAPAGFTVWVVQDNNRGTHHVSYHEGTEEEAKAAAIAETVDDWGDSYSAKNLHVLGVVQGEVVLAEWNELQAWG